MQVITIRAEDSGKLFIAPGTESLLVDIDTAADATSPGWYVHLALFDRTEQLAGSMHGITIVARSSSLNVGHWLCNADGAMAKQCHLQDDSGRYYAMYDRNLAGDLAGYHIEIMSDGQACFHVSVLETRFYEANGDDDDTDVTDDDNEAAPCV